MSKTPILITGGCGFVGANLAVYLAERDYNVIAFDNLVRRGSEMNLTRLHQAGVKFVHGDVRCEEDLKGLPYLDVIVNTAAQPSAIDGYNNPTFDLTNNTIGTLNLLDMCRDRGFKGMIQFSTNKTFSAEMINRPPRHEAETRWIWNEERNHPWPWWDCDKGISERSAPIDGGDHSIYGLSKVMADLACQEYADAFDLRLIVNRFSCIAGTHQMGKTSQGWVTWWAIAALLNRPVTYIGWNGKQVRDVLFIEDLCRLIHLQIDAITDWESDLPHTVYNVGGGRDNTLSLREATAYMQELFPSWNPDPFIINEPRRSDHAVYISDLDRVCTTFGWEPTIGVREGLESIARWVVDNRSILTGLYEE